MSDKTLNLAIDVYQTLDKVISQIEEDENKSTQEDDVEFLYARNLVKKQTKITQYMIPRSQ